MKIIIIKIVNVMVKKKSRRSSRRRRRELTLTLYFDKVLFTGVLMLVFVPEIEVDNVVVDGCCGGKGKAIPVFRIVLAGDKFLRSSNEVLITLNKSPVSCTNSA